jgi:hypothetical protein
MIQRGDVFVVRSPGVLPAVIRWTEVLWSADNVAEYNHAGIVIADDLTTLEARWKVKEWNLSKYAGREIAIYRPTKTLAAVPITSGNIDSAIYLIEENHKGQFYPVHRLFLHLIRPLAKFSYKGRFLVCSELVAKYLHLLGARGKLFAGTNPDMLADEWKHWRYFNLVYKGKMP